MFCWRDFGHIRFLKVGILIQAKIHGVMEEKNSRIDEIVILHGSKNWVIIAKCDSYKKHGSHNKKCNSLNCFMEHGTRKTNIEHKGAVLMPSTSISRQLVTLAGRRGEWPCLCGTQGLCAETQFAYDRCFNSMYPTQHFSNGRRDAWITTFFFSEKKQRDLPLEGVQQKQAPRDFFFTCDKKVRLLFFWVDLI